MIRDLDSPSLVAIGRRSSRCAMTLHHDRHQRTPDGWKFTERL
jgi:hypothetical protein